jgi:hypothetical protein
MMEGLVAESPGTGLQKPIELDFLGARATGDALEFCTRNHLLSDLPKAIETARRFFLIPGSPSVYLERDPEEREQFAVIEIWVEGDVPENFQRYKSYLREWSRIADNKVNSLIRLVYNII